MEMQKLFKIVENFTIWKNNTSPEARVPWQLRTPPNAPTLGEASLLAHFWVCPKSKIIWSSTPKRLKDHVFYEVACKSAKITRPSIDGPKCDFALRKSFSFIFQEIQLTSPRFQFLRCQKRVKKWWKLRVLTCSEDHSYTEIRLPDGCPKSCKTTPKYI